MTTKEQLASVRRQNVERLIEERFDRKQARFAVAINKPANYVWRMLTSGPHAKGIGEDLARHIEDRLGLERYELDKGASQAEEQTLSPAVAQGRLNAVRVVRREAIEEVHGTPSSGWIGRNTIAEVFVAEPYSEDAFAMLVPDRSMAPQYLPGEMLVFDPAVKPEPGDYVLARVGTQVLFRRYRSQGGAFLLDALDEAHAPVWSDRDRVTILGVLVEHHRTRSARKSGPLS